MPESASMCATKIDGVRRVELVPNDDVRGRFTELYREQWLEIPRVVQFNGVSSRPNTMRGIHIHVRHFDWFVLVAGRVEVCLGDLRDSSPTRGQWEVTTLDAELPTVTLIPPGVAHGFYFPVASMHVYGTTEYWQPEEEMGCHWADSSLRLSWSVPDRPLLSDRDAGLGSLSDLLEQLKPYQHLF